MIGKSEFVLHSCSKLSIKRIFVKQLKHLSLSLSYENKID